MNKITNEIIIPRWRFSPLRIFSKTRRRRYVSYTPSNWDECTLDQLRIVAKVHTGEKSKNINRRMMLSFLNVPSRFLKYMSHSQLDEIANTLEFIFDKELLTKETIGNLKLKNKVFFAPKSKLHDISFNQFIYADTLFLNYIKNPKIETLNKMMAVLWLPVENGQRQAFDPERIEHHAAYFAKVSEITKTIMLLFYTGCRNYIVKRHPALFPEQKTTSTSAKDTGTWQDTIFRMVGDQPGDVSKVEKVNVYFALGWLNNEAKTAQESLNKIPKKQKHA